MEYIYIVLIIISLIAINIAAMVNSSFHKKIRLYLAENYPKESDYYGMKVSFTPYFLLIKNLRKKHQDDAKYQELITKTERLNLYLVITYLIFLPLIGFLIIKLSAYNFF